jgi:two-component sensor histidine kinase
VESIADPAALLVSELVTNAVEASASSTVRDHGKLPIIGFAIRMTAASLVLEVWDASPLRPVPRQADVAADRGRGLVLVDALADAWGHRAADGGKIVWCEVAIPSPTDCMSAAS